MSTDDTTTPTPPAALPSDPATVAAARVRMALIDQAVNLFQNRIELIESLTTHDTEHATAIQLYREIITVIAGLRTAPAVVVPELDHDAEMLAAYGHKVSPNGRLERRIVAAFCAHMAAHGWTPCTLIDSDNVRTAVTDTKSTMELLFNLDDAWVVFVKDPNSPKHAVRFVLGNGTDIISDYGYAEGDADGFSAAVDAFDAERFA